MNRKILIQAAAPGVVVGLLLLAACLVSAWHINHLQANLDAIRLQNVASLQAAQELEISLHRLRFLGFLQQLEPTPDRLKEIKAEEAEFEGWLEKARRASNSPQEWDYVHAIEGGYDRYRQDFDAIPMGGGAPYQGRDVGRLAAEHPIQRLVDPCQGLYAVNERMMETTSEDSSHVSHQLRWALLLLGLGGPVSGLIMGYAIARGFSRSIYRLRVRIQDVVQRLEQDVTAVSVTADGDVPSLERQLQAVVGRVEVVLERLRAQQQEVLRAQQLGAVGQLAASVAHEVRNPLTSIKMLVEAALRAQKAKPLTPETLRVIHGEVERLQQTVQSFLDFARPPALAPRACDLRTLVTQAIELIGARARQQRVQLDVVCPPEPVVGVVDPGQLGTVLVNLCLNALDAMPRGGRLEFRLQSDPKDGIRLTVADTGTGIAPDVAERLFTPFISGKPTGTGLGLSISQRIVEEHGGQITADNRPEGGARFTVTLPPLDPEESHADTAGH